MNSTSNNLAPELDPRWAAVLARDPRADGQFVYGVKTTGIYCHPSSLSRLPNPRNVEFFDTPEQAQAAGYRPSKRVARDPDPDRRPTSGTGRGRLPADRSRRGTARPE